MRISKENIVALSILAAVLIVQAVVLAPELTISSVDLNDNVMHWPLIQGMVQAIERGDNPFDWWAPEWSLGYPVLRTYQPLAHAIVVVIYYALFKSVSLMTVFVWVRYLSVLLMPLTFFVTARLLTLSPLTAAAGAMLSPLISTHALYGLEYGSYVWAGSGLFTQAVACHFALLAIGFGYNAIRRGRSIAWTGVLVGLTFLGHFIYGYIAALTLCLLAVIPDRDSPRGTRILRTVWIGAVAFLVAAFELLPLVIDGSIINHSRWEAVWKWDSFGVAQVLNLLFTGDLLDYDRLPVLSLLALAGVVVYLIELRGNVGRFPARTFLAAGTVLWILMFFGRPVWGPALLLLGVSPDMQLHRVIGGAHIFLVLIAAVGLAFIWRTLTQRVHVAAAVMVTAILFYPTLRERGIYLSNNSTWGRRNLDAYNANRRAIDTATEIAKTRGGRAYAGLAATWGGTFKIGDPAVYAYLSEAQVPALSFMYHSMSLSSETMTRFNDGSLAHYRLFDIRTVIAPADGHVPLPEFLTPLVSMGPLKILAAPDCTAFDVVDVFYSVKVSKNNFYDVNDPWQQSAWVGNRQHLLLDLYGDAPSQLARLSADDPLPGAASLPSPGEILSERHDGDLHSATLEAARNGYVLYKTTWHPNWRATVDGQAVRTVMLSPGFVGVPVTTGRHELQLRYQPERWKAVLAILGPLLGIVLIFVERRGFKPEIRVPSFTIPQPARVSALLILLALPVCISLLSSRLPDGHDATEYLPRMVEFHENIRHGILLPRWAPDLSHGAGQPLFLYNPPMFYYLAEVWHLAGFDFVKAMNLACIVIVLASAAGAFLLGRLYFGDAGGWLAATAYLYAPYFAVDLYVRTAWAEFAAFPFFAFALYGFGAYAKSGARKYLLVGAVAYAGILASHNAAALLFTPVLAGFMALSAWMARSWTILRNQALGLALGLALAAFVWIPGLTMNQLVHVDALMQGATRYSNHFVYLHQLIDSPWGYGFSLPGDEDGMSFSLGWTHVPIAIAVMLMIVKSNKAWVWFFAGAAAVLCMLMLPDAQPVWDQIPLLQFVAFPWRLLGPTAMVLAALIAAFGAPAAKLGRWRSAAFTSAMILLIVPNLAHFQPRQFRDIDMKFWSPQEIAERGIEVTSFAEYRPREMDEAPPYDPRPGEIVAGDAEIQQTSKSPAAWTGVVKANTFATVELRLAYFPAWTVFVDGKPVAARAAEKTGLIRFDVPSGEHKVAVEWARTGSLWIADLVSLLALCVLILTAILSRESGPGRYARGSAEAPGRER
ncbi:MAG TPA: glycosyltransferase family 39 protein [Bryobacteraceae bacterium]|nr:glycosyltransferase family 39 protein [Bryobacteraceae bacterium]